MARASDGQRAWDSPAEAVAALCARLTPVAVERVGLAEARGRVLAEALRADRDSPAADVSAMDGYAVRVADFERRSLPVSAEAHIGRAPPELREGTAVRIVTGAPIPAGAEAVVKREDVEERAGEIGLAGGIGARIIAGANIRRRGENIRAGEEIIGAGATITPALAAALAAFGASEPTVRRRVRAAVIVTGDEVLPEDASPSEWELRDSNGAALRAMLGDQAWIEIVRTERAPDDEAALQHALGAALDGADAVFLTGGVSMGQRDFVPDAVRACGGSVVFHRLPQRPGKPVLGAVGPGGQAILGLPGNPVSVLVTARRMGAEVLGALGGQRAVPPALIRLAETDGKTLGLWWHRLVRIGKDGVGELIRGMGSGDLASAARSDGFVEIPPGEDGSEPVSFYSWRW